MNTRELEREIRRSLRELEQLQSQRTGKQPSPVEEIQTNVTEGILALRRVIALAMETKEAIDATPALQSILTMESWRHVGAYQAGDIQDVVAVWWSFVAWLDTEVTVKQADGSERKVTPRKVIQRRSGVYEVPVDPEPGA